MNFDSTPQTPFTFADYSAKPAAAKPAAAKPAAGKPAAAKDAHESDGSDGEAVENPTIVFEGEALLPHAEVKSGEDDEAVLFVQRCKLYRFRDRQWKERGVGDLKILQHTATAKVRVLMRQEKTLKIRANHYLTPAIALGDHLGGNDKTWTWSTHADFADEEVRPELFAVRFAETARATDFAAVFRRHTDGAAKPAAEDAADTLHEEVQKISVRDEADEADEAV